VRPRIGLWGGIGGEEKRRQRTAHLSARGVSVVLPAEQSYRRTMVGDVALTVFLGVEIQTKKCFCLYDIQTKK
jgi:hypothetical protein